MDLRRETVDSGRETRGKLTALALRVGAAGTVASCSLALLDPSAVPLHTAESNGASLLILVLGRTVRRPLKYLKI